MSNIFSFKIPKLLNQIKVSWPSGDLQELKPITGKNDPQAAKNSAIMKSNSAYMSAVTAQTSSVTAQMKANAALMQQAAVAEAARQKEVVRAATQGKIDKNTEANKAFILSALNKPSGFNFKAGGKAKPKSKPVKTAYDLAYDKAYQQALKEYDKKRGVGEKRPFWQKLGDKISFGQDRRDVAARKWAEDNVNKIMENDFKTYESKVNAYIKKQATVQAQVTAAATTMKTQAEYDQFVKQQQDILNKEYGALTKEGASYDARTQAFSKSSQQPLSSFTSKTLSKAAVLASDKNPIWKFTLGSGNKNVPSLVTAPSRAVNWIGNLNTKNRDIYQYGGGTTNRTKERLNAWQASFNQRNFNIRPVVDKPFNREQAERLITKNGDGIVGRDAGRMSFQRMGLEQKYVAAKTQKEKDDLLKKVWDEYNRANRNANSLQEFAADPLIIGGEIGKAARAFGMTDKLSEAGRASKLTKWAFDAADKIKDTKAAFSSKLGESKAVKWLASEHKTPAETFVDTQKAIRDLSRAEQDNLLKKIQSVGEKLAKNPKYDLSIFDDLKSLSAKEREVLQRMSGEGKLAFRDRLLTMGKNGAETGAKFEDIAKKYTAFTEQMKIADNVKSTRFGLGKSRIYSPRTAWADDLDKYNFRLFRKGRQVQEGDDFLHGVVDRFFKSNLDEDLVAKGKNYEKYSKEFKAASNQYTKSFETAKEAIGDARSKLKRDTTGVTGWIRNGKNVRDDVSFGRSMLNTAKNIQEAPTKLWKKSVLKYRPAWTVNNALYNTQAGVLAGGAESLVEQAKMLNPKYWRKAMDEGAIFRSNLGKEIGTKGWLNKFNSGVEDWSRVAAGRAAVKKGLTEEDALGRVNKYLFDYTTKNWERPIKAAIPFWSFQKNLAKAAITMPFDRPIAALGYNRLDRYQQNQYDKEFEKMVPELTRLGYSEDEIQKMKEENAKYFRGRLKVGSRWITTPFNAFSEKGLTNTGLNPWLAAGREVSTSTDSFGQKIGGNEAGFIRRIMSKFPQAEIGRQIFRSRQVDKGELKPSVKYIGKAGSEGYGLGKEKQGYDPKKPNYVPSMDPRRKLGDNLLAFAGVPKSLQFDQGKFLEGKKLQKLTSEYFALNTKGMKFDDAEVERQAIFKKYGVTADQFYKGVLAKYDSDNTTKIKQMKEDAKAANSTLFDEYSKQPYGTRGAWAAKKMEELSKSGYYNDNPFLYSFAKTSDNPKGFITPESVHKIKTGQDKKADYNYAVRTGDWSKWAAKYGVKSEKARIVQDALKTGNWTKYREKYGTNGKQSPFQYAGKYFKTAESMAKYQEGEFWKKYSDAMPDERKKLLADNPKYNTRADWTPEMWRAEKKVKKAELKGRAKGFGDISDFIARNTATTTVKATKFRSTLNRRQKKVSWKLS